MYIARVLEHELLGKKEYYSEPIYLRKNVNICNYFEDKYYGKTVIMHLCENEKQCLELVNNWNNSYVKNKTIYTDAVKLRGINFIKAKKF